MNPLMASDRERSLAQAKRLLSAVTDPEIPVVSLDEMGILRGIFADADTGIRVLITPTYSGCPAMTQIEDDIRAALQPLGQTVTVETQLSPAWTTDWMTSSAKEKLRAYGIAPPSRHCGSAATQPKVMQFIRDAAVVDAVDCPHCGSAQTVESSHFGSTPCKALYKCLSCQEPFDYFKPF